MDFCEECTQFYEDDPQGDKEAGGWTRDNGDATMLNYLVHSCERILGMLRIKEDRCWVNINLGFSELIGDLYGDPADDRWRIIGE